MSYPQQKYPKDKKTQEARQQWWETYLEENQGALHRIHYHRIVMDEAQIIKNPCGEMYESVRALKATHRWLLFGTPIVDSPSELYAYYRIINKAYTGNLQSFAENFLKKKSRNAQERLNYSMHNFILRRTLDDVLDGEKLLALPRAKETRITCEFSNFERKLYDAIIQKYEVLMDQAAESQKSVRWLYLW